MYEKQFGLSRRPFRANATGADVFVGPQTARTMAGMKKALAATEAVVAITGEPGVGKSTLVNRAIDAVGGDRLVVLISRMQLGHDEVLDFLLEKFDASNIPASTIKKINLFRDLLGVRTGAGTRVFIVIEDAVRIGEDALAEFEALTAPDTNHPEGANIILMGDNVLLEHLEVPALVRLKQRTRLRHQILPLTTSELLAYLKHCFRLAGGEFDLSFEDGSGQLLFELSQGNPRVANNLVESILTAAAEQKTSKVDATLIKKVADEQYGLSVSTPSVVQESATEQARPVPLQPAEQDETPDLIHDTLPDLEVLAPGLAAQGLVISQESEPPQSENEEIPTLFTSMRLEKPVAAEDRPVAVPELVAKTPKPAPKPEPVAQAPKPVPIPEPVAQAPKPVPKPKPVAATPKPAPKAEPVAEAPKPAPKAEPAPQAANSDEDDPPAWDRDPTFAELRPDIEALEQAMADFQQEDDEPKPVKESEPMPEVELKDPTLPGVPELTLDMAIENKIHEAQEALAKTDAAIDANAAPDKADTSSAPEPKVGVPPLVSPPPEVKDQKADAELEKIAAGLARAKSIEDVDDQMAETLFGEEFSLVAAQVVANSPMPDSANQAPEAAARPMPNAVEEQPAQTSMEREFKEVHGDNALEVSIETASGGGLDLSASRRLATVRALNADKTPAVGVPPVAPAINPSANGAAAKPAPAARPAPIEDQIMTSMTQTLEALSSRPKPSIEDDDEDPKGGFFSRFKR